MYTFNLYSIFIFLFYFIVFLLQIKKTHIAKAVQVSDRFPFILFSFQKCSG